MKKLYFVLAFCSFSLISFAQPRPTQVDYQKISRPAIQYDFPFAAKTIENALDDYFSKKGYKSSNSKGFTVYRAVRINDLGPDSYDMFFTVEKKGKKDKDNSTVTMMISSGNDTFNDQDKDKNLYNNSISFLDSLKAYIAAYDLNQQIIAQEEEVKSAEKKSKKLIDEGKELESKKLKLEDDIADNIKDKEKQTLELEKQRQILDALKARRTPAAKQ